MEDSVDKLQQRLTDAVTEVLSKVENGGLRPMQADMYKCSARCAEDTSISSNRMEPCIEKCSRVLQSFQEEVGRELETFQNRFQRCAMDCQDRMRDRGLTSQDSEFVSCLTKCTDDHVSLVPAMGKRLESSMEKAMKQRVYQ